MLRQASVLVVLGWALAAAAAATASKADVSTTFAVTVEGSQRTVVTSARRTIDELGCAVRRSDLERQTLSFTTRSPRRLVAVRGRTSSTAVRIAVTATGTKQRTRAVSGTAPDCAVAPQTSRSSCGPSTYGGRAIVTLPTFGSVRLSGSPVRRRDNRVCAPTAAPGRGFLARSDGEFPARPISDPKVARVILRGNVRFTDKLPHGARRVTILRWKITLRRLP